MMTRYLGVEKFGWYITTISFLSFIGILIDFGMTPVTAQMLGENKFDKTKLFNNLLTFRFFSALFFLSIAPLFAIFFPYPHEVKVAIAFTAISFFAIALNQVFIGFLQEKLKMQIQATGEIISRLILVIGLFLAIYNQAQFLTLMWIIILGSISYTFSLYLYIRKQTKINFEFNKNIWLSIITKMWPITIGVIFNVIYLRGDVLLLSYFKAQTEVSIYGAAYRVIDIVTQTAMMIMGVMLPLLANSWAQNNKEEFLINFTYNSNAIEGNTLTLHETALIIKEGITIDKKPLREHLEAIGHKEAYLFVEELVEQKKLLSEKIIWNEFFSKNREKPFRCLNKIEKIRFLIGKTRCLKGLLNGKRF